MSFGIQNLGVINQKDAPAIWESDLVDFPANFVKGRILIDTFFGGIYLDTTTTRVQIQAGGNGTINYQNGVETFGLTNPTTSNVGLGGSLVRNTDINLDTNKISFIGSNTNFVINDTGVISDNFGNIYFPAIIDPTTLSVPNTSIIFTNAITGDLLRVLAEIL